MKSFNYREHNTYPILKEVAKDLLRDCDSSASAQRDGRALLKVFELALTDVALDMWYMEGK